jgi:uncharacterized membrane protein
MAVIFRGVRPYFIAGAVVGLSALYYQYNEAEVEQRAARLDRISIMSVELPTHPRTLASDINAQKCLESPLIITGLIDSWPASQTWTFENLRLVLPH